MSETSMSQTKRTTTTWEPRARRPFRVMAGIVAVLGFFACIAFAMGAIMSFAERMIALAVVLPFSLFMLRIAIRGSVSVQISQTTTTVEGDSESSPDG